MMVFQTVTSCSHWCQCHHCAKLAIKITAMYSVQYILDTHTYRYSTEKKIAIYNISQEVP